MGMVELCSRYSNRDDLLESLVRVLEQINQDLVVSESKDQLVSADGATSGVSTSSIQRDKRCSLVIVTSGLARWQKIQVC